MCECEHGLLDDSWISEVAEHSLFCCLGVKSLELTDLHLCDGQAWWGRLQLPTEKYIILPVIILNNIFTSKNKHESLRFSVPYITKSTKYF